MSKEQVHVAQASCSHRAEHKARTAPKESLAPLGSNRTAGQGTIVPLAAKPLQHPAKSWVTTPHHGDEAFGGTVGSRLVPESLWPSLAPDRCQRGQLSPAKALVIRDLCFPHPGLEYCTPTAQLGHTVSRH